MIKEKYVQYSIVLVSLTRHLGDISLQYKGDTLLHLCHKTDKVQLLRSERPLQQGKKQFFFVLPPSEILPIQMVNYCRVDLCGLEKCCWEKCCWRHFIVDSCCLSQKNFFLLSNRGWDAKKYLAKRPILITSKKFDEVALLWDEICAYARSAILLHNLQFIVCRQHDLQDFTQSLEWIPTKPILNSWYPHTIPANDDA